LLRAKIETLFSISSQLRPIRPMRDVIPRSCEIKGQCQANSLLWLSAFKHRSIDEAIGILVLVIRPGRIQLTGKCGGLNGSAQRSETEVHMDD
jgi:hypothetical protein